MTTQQPTQRQGANAWKMGVPLDIPIFAMGFFFVSLWILHREVFLCRKEK